MNLFCPNCIKTEKNIAPILWVDQIGAEPPDDYDTADGVVYLIGECQYCKGRFEYRMPYRELGPK